MYIDGNTSNVGRPGLVLAAFLMSVGLFCGLGIFNRMEGRRVLSAITDVEIAPASLQVPDDSLIRNEASVREADWRPPMNYRVPDKLFGVEESARPMRLGERITEIPLAAADPRIKDRPDDYVYEAHELDAIPIPLIQVKPAYPERMKYARIQSKVVVIVSIDKEGEVFDVQIEEAEFPDFAESVVNAVMMWKFIPGRKDGNRVNQRVRLPVSFKLRPKTPDATAQGEDEPIYSPLEVHM